MRRVIAFPVLGASLVLAGFGCGGSTSAFARYRILLTGHNHDSARIFLWRPGSKVKALTEAVYSGQAGSGQLFGLSGGSWSPDGRSIAYADDYVITTNGGVYRESEVMRADGTHARLTDAGSASFLQFGGFGPPSWSPDGRRIVYETEIFGDGETASNPIFAVVDVSSGRRRNFPADGASDGPADVTSSDPAWGKPGIAYHDGSKIMLLNPATGRSRVLARSFPVGPLAWSPGGVLAVGEPKQITLLAASGRVIAKIPTATTAGPVCALAWSSNGKQILAASSARDKYGAWTGIRGLWVGTVSTKQWQQLPSVPSWSGFTYDCSLSWR